MVVWMAGGLGNQMFMYAFGKALQDATGGGDLIFDASWCKIYEEYLISINQGYDIKYFNVDMSGFDEDFDKELFFKKHDKFYEKFYSKKYQLKRKYLGKFIRKYRSGAPTYLHFVRDLECTVFDLINSKIHPDSYFFGYWQSLSYFSHLDKMLRAEFTLKEPLNEANLTLEKRILNTPNSVFLHVRRGDYPENWRVVGGAYYESAVLYMKQKLSKPHIFVFSDEIEWCEREFLGTLSSEAKSGVEFEFVKNDNRLNATAEMQLMRSCSHAIIANSTFSWWASYLMPNPDKIVIMPSQFFVLDGHLPPHPLFLVFKGAVLINTKNGRIEREF